MMYRKQTRAWCYAITLLPTLIGLVLWKTLPSGQTAFPAAMLLSPVIMALTLAFCLYMTDKLEGDKEKNKKINSVVIWLIPVLSNFTFWISYALVFRGMKLNMMRLMSWLFAGIYLVLGNYLPKCRPNSVVGFRVKWTASTEENWNATHRLAGPCYVVCGFLMLAGSFLPEKAAAGCQVILLVLSNAIPLVYSYAFYKKQQRQGAAFQPRPKWEGKLNKAALGFTAAILVLVAGLLFTGSVKYRFSDTALNVDVSYYGSASIPYADISGVELRRENVDGVRQWGLGSFRLLAGSFHNAEFGDYTRLTYYNPQSTIVVRTSEGKIFVLSDKTPQNTQMLYEKILTYLN